MACKPRAAALLVEPMSLKPGRRRGITKLRRAQHASKDAWKLKTVKAAKALVSRSAKLVYAPRELLESGGFSVDDFKQSFV